MEWVNPHPIPIQSNPIRSDTILCDPQYPIPNPHRNPTNNVYNNFININKCSRSVCFCFLVRQLFMRCVFRLTAAKVAEK